jgi:MraZ protein
MRKKAIAFWVNRGYTGARWGKVVNKGSARFLGQFEHGLDDKNRLFLPARFRQSPSSETFVVMQGIEPCLLLLPPAAWDTLAARLESLPLDDKSEERAVRRSLLASAAEAETDAQGRVLIPQHLKEYAGIKRDVVIIGMLRYTEIWSKENWLTYRRKAQAALRKASPHLEL